jgi:hypothetical protein
MTRCWRSVTLVTAASSALRPACHRSLVFGGVSSRDRMGGLRDLELGGLQFALELAMTDALRGSLLAQLVQLGVGSRFTRHRCALLRSG